MADYQEEGTTELFVGPHGDRQEPSGGGHLSSGQEQPCLPDAWLALDGHRRQAPTLRAGDRVHPAHGPVQGVGVHVERERADLVLDPADAALPGDDGDQDELFGAGHVGTSDRADPL